MSVAHLSDDVLMAYAVGALDPEERASVEAHLRRCPDCLVELERTRETAELLAMVAPPVEPPAGMRERVLARAVATPQTQVMRPTAERPTAGRRTGRWPALLAAASLLLAAALGWSLMRERAERRDLLAQLQRAETDLAARDSLLAASNEMLQRVLGPEVQTTTLAATGAAPSMRIFWDHGRSVMIVSARRLPPAAAGRTYQLWGIGADGVPVGIGTFNTRQDGAAVITLAVTPGSQFTVSAVTEEPAGGSAQPTTTPFLVGNWPTT